MICPVSDKERINIWIIGEDRGEIVDAHLGPNGPDQYSWKERSYTNLNLAYENGRNHVCTGRPSNYGNQKNLIKPKM